MDFSNLLIRCHALSNIMGACKDSITDKQLKEIESLQKMESLTTKQKTELTRLRRKRDNPPKYDLSEGAKSYIKKIVKRKVFQYTEDIETNAIRKGIMCEPDAIDLYNRVHFTRYKKHEGRKQNGFITGECDVLVPNTKVIDFKCSESKKTFPATKKDIKIGGYLWQGIGYMWLYEVENFELCFALVDTPPELLEYESNLSIHDCEDIEDHLKLTSIHFKRDRAKEELIVHKVKECRRYAQDFYKELTKKNL